MAKKQLDDDLLTGGSIKDNDDVKASKKSSKPKKSGKGISKRTQTIIKSAVCVVVVIALLVTYVATGAVRKGFVSSIDIPAKCFTGMTVTNGEQKAKIKVATYNFYFATQYNSMRNTQSQYKQYGLDPAQFGMDVDFEKSLAKQDYTDTETNETITWAEHMHNLTVDAIEKTYTYYLAAVAANNGEEPEITEEQQNELEETLTSYTESANQNGYTLSGYLTAVMGHGVDEKLFRQESIRQFIASNYQNELSENAANTEYTEDEINKYRDEHLDELQTVDIRLFECASEDDAKAFKDALNSDGSNFSELCVQYASTDFAKKAYTEDGYSTEIGVNKSVLQNKGYAIGTANHNHEEGEEHSDDEVLEYPGIDWLFSTDRQAGDTYQYSTSVVYVIRPVGLADTKTVNVRHILISPITDEDDSTQAVDATDAQWVAAFSTATDILQQWEDGDKTAESFGALAEEKSVDTGSASNGGLYENVTTGQMVNSFSTWCFDTNRKAGDTAIVRSDYGYHIMYFEGANDQTVWQYTAQQALASDDGTTLVEELEESYTVNVKWFGSRYFEKDVDIDR